MRLATDHFLTHSIRQYNNDGALAVIFFFKAILDNLFCRWRTFSALIAGPQLCFKMADMAAAVFVYAGPDLSLCDVIADTNIQNGFPGCE